MNAAKIKLEGMKLFVTNNADVDGIKMNFAESGKGQAIIMIPGWTNDWTGLTPVGVYLRDKYRVIIVDLPGFGGSGELPKYNFRVEADYLHKLIEVLGLKNPIVVGHSMGAFISASFYKRHPTVAKSIIMLAPVFHTSYHRWKSRIMGAFYRTVQKTETSQNILKRIVDRDEFSYFTAKFINMYRFDKKLIQCFGFEGKKKVRPKTYIDIGVEVTETYIETLINNNKIPIGMVLGKYDKLSNIGQAKRLLDGKGNYFFEEVDNAGHLLTVEKPKETAKAIEKLISKMDANKI